MTERAPSFSAYFPDQEANPNITIKREVYLHPGNYYIYGSSFIKTKANVSDEGQAIYVRDNANPIYLAVVLCRFQNLYSERRGTAINFQSSLGGACIDKCTGNDCNAVKGADDIGFITGGQFADLDPPTKVNMTSVTECSSSKYFDGHPNHPERPFSFNKGPTTINSVNISDCYCWHINGFYLSGTLESARYITASGGKTDTIMFWFENVQNPVVEYVTVQQMTITTASKNYAFIFANNCGTVTFNYLTVNDVSVTGKPYLFSSKDSNTNFNLNHNYISNRDEWDIISKVAATDNRAELIPDDHVYFTEEQLNSTLDPQPTEEHETTTTTTAAEQEEHEIPTENKEEPTENKGESTENKGEPTDGKGEPTRSPEGGPANLESRKVGSLDRNTFIIIIVVCAVILILIIVIVAIVILRRKKDIKEDNYHSSSSEFNVPEAPASTVVPETVFPTETVQTEAGMWTTNAYENDDPFKPELENSSSDSPDVQIDGI